MTANTDKPLSYPAEHWLPASTDKQADPPTDALLHQQLAAVQRAQGDELAALAHLVAAQSLEACQQGPQARAIQDVCDIATGYFMKGNDDARAEYWYRLTLKLDPDKASAWQNLTELYARRGQLQDSERCRERTYALQRVFVELAPQARRNLLLLCSGRTSGNIPFDTLLSAGHSHRIKYAIDYAHPDEDKLLPACHLIFNVIGDPDVAEPLAQRVRDFAAHSGLPLLNAPEAVVRTQRHRLSALLGDIPDLVIPPCLRASGSPASAQQLAEELAAAGLHLPLLVRPAATHGGQGVVLCQQMDEVWEAVQQINGPHYLTQYVDCRDADSFFRKYRMVFIGGQAYPYHLAVSPNWMVHYFSAQMLEHEWKIAEELRFLQDPAAALGHKAMQAICRLGQALELDYAGVDFTVLADGRVLLFETNATMLIHRERINGPLQHKNAFVEHIVQAFEQWQQQRLLSCGKTTSHE